MVYIALGSNLGDRETNLETALTAMAAEGIEITKRSSLYETAPRDVLDQPWFLNMVVKARTQAEPRDLLEILMRIEQVMGRERTVQGGPRTIDLDILLYGELVISNKTLTVPHPRMLERRFVLEPLLEIAPDLIHPVSKTAIADSLTGVLDQEIKRRSSR